MNFRRLKTDRSKIWYTRFKSTLKCFRMFLSQNLKLKVTAKTTTFKRNRPTLKLTLITTPTWCGSLRHWVKSWKQFYPPKQSSFSACLLLAWHFTCHQVSLLALCWLVLFWCTPACTLNNTDGNVLGSSYTSIFSWLSQLQCSSTPRSRLWEPKLASGKITNMRSSFTNFLVSRSTPRIDTLHRKLEQSWTLIQNSSTNTAPTFPKVSTWRSVFLFSAWAYCSLPWTNRRRSTIFQMRTTKQTSRHWALSSTMKPKAATMMKRKKLLENHPLVPRHKRTESNKRLNN